LKSNLKKQFSAQQDAVEDNLEVREQRQLEEEKGVRELVIRSQQGDQEAFRELVDIYRTRVASIAYGVVGNYEDARDISQEVFIKIYRSLSRFDTKKKFFTWLYRLTVNASIDFLRANKKRSLHDSIESDDSFTQYPDKREESNIDGWFENLEQREIFEKIVEYLNPRQKMAFVLCDLKGFTSNEAAKIIECPQTTLRWYLHEARKKIRATVQTEYPEYFRQGKKTKPDD